MNYDFFLKDGNIVVGIVNEAPYHCENDGLMLFME